MTAAIVVGALYGLHAAHEARDELGESLGIVHRDVSPQNLLVGVDGLTRVVDFGVAKAHSRVQSTRDGQLKGKLAYMAPEQILRKGVDRRADIYSAGVVLWESLALERLFRADDAGAVIAAVLEGVVPPVSQRRSDVPPALDAVIAKAMARDPEVRFASAQDFAAALEEAIPPAPQREVGAWVTQVGGGDIEGRRKLVATIEKSPMVTDDASDAAVEGLLAHRLSEDEARRLATALTTSLPSPTRKARRWPYALGVLGLLGPGAFWALRKPPTPPPPVATPPVVMTTVAALPAASSVAALPDVPTQIPSATVRAAKARTPPPPRASASAPSDKGCDPPFSLDPQGIKRFKPWCL